MNRSPYISRSILEVAFAYICQESRLIRYRNNPPCFLIAVIITVLDAARAGAFGLLNQMERPPFRQLSGKVAWKTGTGDRAKSCPGQPIVGKSRYSLEQMTVQYHLRD